MLDEILPYFLGVALDGLMDGLKVESTLVMCWAGLKPEAEPGPAHLSPAQPGPCCGLCAGLGQAPDFSGPKPGLRPGLSTHLYYICILPSCSTTRQAGRQMHGN